MSIEKLKFQISDSLEPVPAEAWDRLVGEEGTPFMEYAWLRGLEVTGCVDPEVGWMPQIVTAWEERDGEADRLVGAVPLYLKGNSRGEFVYDWAWADLARRVGVPYYPKMIAAVPFSPVSGARLLTNPDLSEEERGVVLRAIVQVSIQLAREMGVSGLHFLFVTPEHARLLEDEGLMIRNHYQYHWRNEGYDTFDDFLGRFKSKKRNNIKRELRDVSDAGVTFETRTGAELDDALMDHLFAFYTSTCDKFVWGQTYLNRPFFEHVRAHMPERLLMFLARDGGGDPVAGTFNLFKGDRMYGRYWGCHREIEFLHFVTCCYEPIDYAIQRGIKHFEPGQGGHHKYKRGFEPVKTWSAHWIADPRMAALLKQHLRQEREAVDEEIARMLSESPLVHPPG